MGTFDIVEVRLGELNWKKELQMVICGASGGSLMHRVVVS